MNIGVEVLKESVIRVQSQLKMETAGAMAITWKISW